MDERVRYTNGWLWLTAPIAILLTIAAGGGVFIHGLYHDTPYFVAQAVGQDMISLAVVLPVLIVSAFLTGRGSPRAWVIWLGGLVYLVYTYVVAAFDVKFNSLFLVYVALLACSLYALIGSLVTANMAEIKACFSKKTPVRPISFYLAALAVLFYFMWLSEIVPALLAGTIPLSVQDNGTATNAVHVLDMAWILPAFGITAISLWRKQALGYTLAGALLSYSVLLILAILGMVVSMVRDGHTVVVPQVVIFGALLAINLGMLIWYLKGVLPSKPRSLVIPHETALQMINLSDIDLPEIDLLEIDLLDQLLEHDAWTTRQVLEFAKTLTDEQLDQDFDIGHRTVRATVHHILGNIEAWTDLMAARPVRRMPATGQSIVELRQRFEAAFGDFTQVARQLRDARRLNDMYLDVLDQPPQQKSYAGSILHVITHDHLHRTEILHMLQRLGVPGLIEGDVLSWEASCRNRRIV